jgi:fructose-1-phosphate kinase PfkB-like protein
VGFEVRDVRADEQAAQEVAALGYQGTPVVVAGDMHAHGYRKEWLDTVIEAVRAEDAEGAVDAELAAIEECAA